MCLAIHFLRVGYFIAIITIVKIRAAKQNFDIQDGFFITLCLLFDVTSARLQKFSSLFCLCGGSVDAD